MTARSTRYAASLATSVVPLTMPIGEQANFSGVVDLVSGKAYSFANDKVDRGRDSRRHGRRQISAYREQLVETAVESDDDLMTKYLEGEEISEDELRRAIKARRRGGNASARTGWLGQRRTSACSHCSTPSPTMCPQRAERAEVQRQRRASGLRLQDHRRSAEGHVHLLPRLRRHRQVGYRTSTT